jgi:hypothetical protein
MNFPKPKTQPEAVGAILAGILQRVSAHKTPVPDTPAAEDDDAGEEAPAAPLLA